jgi:hypothetical protein
MRKRLTAAATLGLVVLFWAVAAGAQVTTIDFDAPAPPGSSGDLLNGLFRGVDFGTAQWRWEGPYSVDPTNHVYFDSPTGTSRTFRFSPGPRTLVSMRVFTTVAGTLTLSDDVGQTLARSVGTGAMQTVVTGWIQPPNVVTVSFSAGWELGVDDIVYQVPGGASDAVPPFITSTRAPEI